MHKKKIHDHKKRKCENINLATDNLRVQDEYYSTGYCNTLVLMDGISDDPECDLIWILVTFSLQYTSINVFKVGLSSWDWSVLFFFLMQVSVTAEILVHQNIKSYNRNKYIALQKNPHRHKKKEQRKKEKKKQHRRIYPYYSRLVG